MRTKFMSKAVIYLLVTTIALPMWFLSGLFTQHAKAAGDTIKPYGTIDSPLASSYHSNNILVSGTAFDDDSGIDKVEVRMRDMADGLKGLFNANYNSATGGWSVTINDGVNNVPDAVYSVRAVLYDNAGNEKWLKVEPVTIDTIVPVCDITSPLSGAYVGKNYITSGTASDSGSDIKEVRVRFKDMDSTAAYVEKAVYDSSMDTWALTVNNGALTIPDGRYKAVCVVFDNAGNKSNDKEKPIYVDTTDPIAPTSISAVTNSPSATVTWNAGFDDHLAGYNVYRSDDGFATSISGLLPTTQLSYTDTSFPASGIYSYKVSAVDLAGNETLSAESNSVYIYLTAPSAPVVTVTKAGDKLIKVSFNGVGRAAEKYETYVNGILSGTDTNITGDDTGVTYSREISVTDYGTYNVYVKAIGMSGDSSSTTQSIMLAKVTGTTPVVKAIAGPVEAPLSIAPESAVAAEPTDEGTGLDEQGKILGDENADTEEEENINWTPWIILFILIVLAGAATGGYFYWFSGEEDVEAATEVKEKKPVAPKKAPKKQSVPAKKPRRW